MGIRKAKLDDWNNIAELLDQLGYPDTQLFLKERIQRLIDDPDEELLVYEKDEEVLAVLSLHFIPQLALEGDFARISYFVVNQGVRNKGIGREMEDYCSNLAKERGCDRLEVHCHDRRQDAHRFYLRQGFMYSPKYLIKIID